MGCIQIQLWILTNSGCTFKARICRVGPRKGPQLDVILHVYSKSTLGSHLQTIFIIEALLTGMWDSIA